MEAFKEFITDANLVELMTSWAINIVLALVIFIVGKWVANRVEKTLEKFLTKRKIDPVLVDFLGTIARALILIVAIVAAVDVLGIPARGAFHNSLPLNSA